MKRIVKFIAIVLTLGIVFSFTVSADTRSYWFPFPGFGIGSLCVSDIVNPKSASSPYVQATANAHATSFYLSSEGTVADQDTNIVTVIANDFSIHYFTWINSSSTSYHLVGFPNINYGSWTDYNGEGNWVN